MTKGELERLGMTLEDARSVWRLIDLRFADGEDIRFIVRELHFITGYPLAALSRLHAHHLRSFCDFGERQYQLFTPTQILSPASPRDEGSEILPGVVCPCLYGLEKHGQVLLTRIDNEPVYLERMV